METLVLPKNGLAQDIKLNEIKNKIIERLMKIENLQTYKLNNEFLVLACNLIEFYVKKKYNIDKSNLLVNIYEALFQDFTDDEKSTIRQNITFIWNNGHIKKIAYYKLFCVGIKEWIKKKFA